MKTLQITESNLKTAYNSASKESQELLENLFPDVFEDNKIFCQIGDVFYIPRQNTNNYYVFQRVQGKTKVGIINLREGKQWNTTINSRYNSIELENNLTYGEVKELLSKTSRKIEDVVILPKPRDIDWDKFKIEHDFVEEAE